MKKIICSFTIFALLIISLVFSINYLNRTCNELKTIDIKIEEYVMNEDWNKAYDSSIYLLDKWSKYSKVFSIFVTHQEVDNINNELFKLISYIKTKEKPEALASTQVLKFYMKHVIDMEKINLENIL